MSKSMNDANISERDVPGSAAANANEQPGFFSIENLRSLFILILAIFALRWSVASPYHVPTASMEPTIKVGDRLLANKLAYNLKVPFTDYVIASWSTPHRGDIIVFKYPRDPSVDYVKRVVGVAGDQIKVIDDIIYINGQPQARVAREDDRAVLNDIEDHKDNKLLYQEDLEGIKHWTMQNLPYMHRYIPDPWPGPGETYTVPANSVFCMGDNRDNSTDSRVWGEVPLSYVRGKAEFVIWSVFTPDDATWPEFRFSRIGHWLH